MERMLVVTFSNESTANQGLEALQRLDNEGSIVLYAAAIVAKKSDGSIELKQGGEPGLLGTLTGTTVGSLIGLLGGPVGLAVGAATGALGGAIADLENARVGTDFLQEVGDALTPGKVAVIAHIDEDWTTPVDTGMEALGGFVYRRSLAEVLDLQDEKDIATMEADMAQLEAENAKASADRKAKLQSRIDDLNSKLRQRLDQAKSKREAFRRQAEEKVHGLEAKAAQAKRDMRAKQEERLAAARKDYKKWVERSA